MITTHGFSATFGAERVLVSSESNTLEPTEAGMWAKTYHLFMYRREEYMAHYHKRSNIETALSMIKGKFGSALRSKSDTEADKRGSVQGVGAQHLRAGASDTRVGHQAELLSDTMLKLLLAKALPCATLIED